MYLGSVLVWDDFGIISEIFSKNSIYIYNIYIYIYSSRSEINKGARADTRTTPQICPPPGPNARWDHFWIIFKKRRGDVPNIFFPSARPQPIAPRDGISRSGEPLTPTRCLTTVARADIEGSKTNVAVNASPSCIEPALRQ